jgi:hypothetical protein
MINYAGSITYFQGHLKGNIWTQAGEKSCTVAIAAARKVLSRGLGRAMDDSEVAYEEGDTCRDEYAVYEQALYLLENGVIANGDGSAPQPILTGATEAPDQPRRGESSLYAPEALRWLGYTGSAIIKG